MAGFLKNLKKKQNKASSIASNLLLQGKNVAASRLSTEVVQVDSKLGAAEDLLRELQSDGELIKAKASAPASQHLEPTRVGQVTTILGTKAAARPRVKLASDVTSTKKKQDIFDEQLPWWLTDPVVSSPQVDLLVPAARLVLNDLINESSRREDLPQLIQKAVSIAAGKKISEVRFSQKDLHDATTELASFMLGKGPLQPLYDDPAVTDIYMDGHDSIKCVRRGQALETPFRYRSAEEYEAAVANMLQSVERVLNMSSPIVDCVLGDQWRSRINAVHSSLLDGRESSLVIRVPRMQQISFYDLLQTRTLPAAVAAWLAELVSDGEANILVLGPTGSGKTTLTTALLSAVGSDERICTIEDVPEIFVPTAHLEKLVARPENSQGEGAVDMHKLLRAALRRAPHRIVVGEIRDKEGPLFLKALETGHMGSVATIHAENPRDGLWRLLDVVAAIEKAPQESIQRRISRSLNIMISMRKVNGRPCLMDISEVRPPVGGEFVVTQLVRFENEEYGKRNWRIVANHSHWLDRLASKGMELQAGPNLLPMDKAHDTSRGLS